MSFSPGIDLQQFSRLAADALAVGEMTGVLISHSHFEGASLPTKAEIAEKFAGIFDAAR